MLPNRMVLDSPFMRTLAILLVAGTMMAQAQTPRAGAGAAAAHA